MIRTTVAAFGSFVIFVIGHFLHFHYFAPYDKIHSVLIAAGVGLVLFLVFWWFLPLEEKFQQWTRLNDKRVKLYLYPLLGVLFYGFLFLGYLEFYFTADRSITFRMLMITAEQPNRSITVPQLMSIYDTPGIIRRRFDDLKYGGYYAEQDGVYTLTPKGESALSIYKLAIEYLHLSRY